MRRNDTWPQRHRSMVQGACGLAQGTLAAQPARRTELSTYSRGFTTSATQTGIHHLSAALRGSIAGESPRPQQRHLIAAQKGPEEGSRWPSGPKPGAKQGPLRQLQHRLIVTDGIRNGGPPRHQQRHCSKRLGTERKNKENRGGKASTHRGAAAGRHRASTAEESRTGGQQPRQADQAPTVALTTSRVSTARPRPKPNRRPLAAEPLRLPTSVAAEAPAKALPQAHSPLRRPQGAYRRLLHAREKHGARPRLAAARKGR